MDFARDSMVPGREISAFRHGGLGPHFGLCGRALMEHGARHGVAGLVITLESAAGARSVKMVS
jgi:hypothetical protein